MLNAALTVWPILVSLIYDQTHSYQGYTSPFRTLYALCCVSDVDERTLSRFFFFKGDFVLRFNCWIGCGVGYAAHVFGPAHAGAGSRTEDGDNATSSSKRYGGGHRGRKDISYAV
jgi:hypothetical protein